MKKHLTVALLTALTLVGCSKAPESGDTASVKLPVQQSAEIFKQVAYNSTQEITAPGRYFIDIATGKVQLWQAGGNAKLVPGPDQSPHWVAADDGATAYWLDRATGAAYSWKRSELSVQAAGSGKVLVREMKGETATNTFHVADEAFRAQRTFTLDVRSDEWIHARFSPDGKAIAISAWRQANQAGEANGARAFVVDLTKGSVKELEKQPDSLAGGAIGVRTDLAGPSEWFVIYQGGTIEPSGLSRYTSVVRRYDWQGKLLGEFTLKDGNGVQPSPDGKLLAVSQDLDHVAPAALVADAATGNPLFRVAGMGGSQWLADGSGLVLGGAGPYRLVSSMGELKPAPAIPPTEVGAFEMGVKPSPDDPNRFIAGMAVVDAAGKPIYEVKLPKRDDWLVWGLAWGRSANELVLTIFEPMGKGNLGGDFPLPPRVQKAPFSDPYILQVDDPKGECLNLRSLASTSGSIDRCLPSGTKLAVGDLSQAPQKMNQAYVFENNQYWFWVRTEQGETGWVSGSTGSLRWAD